MGCGQTDAIGLNHLELFGSIGILSAGGHFTMDMAGAAYAARRYFDFKTVIPCHYGTFPILTGTPDVLREELEHLGLGDVAVLSPAPGETVG